MSRVYELADDYVVRYAALHPNAATSMGVPGHERALTDFSPEGHEARAALERETLAALEAAPIEGDRDRVARDAMAERLRLALELDAADEQYRSLNILASPLQSLRRVFDLMPRETEQQWSNVSARLAALPAALAGYRALLDAGIERGIVGTRRQAAECAQQAAVWSGQEGGPPPFFETLVSGFDGSPAASGAAGQALAAELAASARTASEAFSGVGRYLAERYTPAAEPRDPVGRERYALGARVFTGTELDLEETYAWGWSELRRIEAELAETAERIQPGAGLEAVKELLETDPARAIEGEEPFRAWMQELQDTTITELHGTHFDLPEPVRRIEALIAPPGGALAMYYTGPSEDFSRPGRTWYPTGGKTRFPLWGEVSIAYHEGVPGHHLQIATTVHLREALSRWQRLMGGTSGYVEGWALYAERAHGRARLPREPGLPPRHAARAGAALRARGGRHRDAPRAADRERGPLPPGRDVDARARPRVHPRAQPLPARLPRQRGRPLPRGCRGRRSATRSASAPGSRPARRPAAARGTRSTCGPSTRRRWTLGRWGYSRWGGSWGGSAAQARHSTPRQAKARQEYERRAQQKGRPSTPEPGATGEVPLLPEVLLKYLPNTAEPLGGLIRGSVA